jgi:hypothetical protein
MLSHKQLARALSNGKTATAFSQCSIAIAANGLPLQSFTRLQRDNFEELLQTPFALGVRRDSDPNRLPFESARLSRRALKLPITHGFSQFEIWYLLCPYQGARSEPALSEVDRLPV